MVAEERAGDALAGAPTGDLAPPVELVPLLGGADAVCVWVNELGGRTYRLTAADRVRYLKWARAGSGLDLVGEAERMRWAGRFVPVPVVIDVDPHGSWLLTEGVDARSAVHPMWRPHATTAAAAIGEGLRRLHEDAPVDGCPYDWSVEQRFANAAARGLTPESALAAPPPVDRLVVAHGDACAPNTLLDADGRFAALVDLGALGVADRWADLAVATMSLGWNFPVADVPTAERALFEAYGVAPDPVRIDYYRRLWNTT